MSVSPAGVTLAPGQAQVFVATVKGGVNTAVDWSITGGSVTGGSLEAEGATITYTAPDRVGNYFVTASSVADPAKRATVTVVVSRPSEARVAGTVTLAEGTGAEGADDEQALSSLRVGPGQRFVAGDVIVKYKPLAEPLAPLELQAEALGLERVRTLGLAAAHLYRDPGLDEAATLALIRRLNARPDVLYAQPNFILETTASPNDPHYPLQWHYQAINLPKAWELSKGSAETVVAVVDTGILFEAGSTARTHPDLAGKVLPGYDFITDPNAANDGNGRDANPYDNGDNPGEQSSYHGSHVAGTVAAATNNGTGVAGVNWAAKILPVRVLGVGGSGTLADVLDGVMWAAGFSVAGVPKNPNPAQVINLSLGGEGSCSRAEQEAYDKVTGAGAVVVVAAGNKNVDAARFTPAGCRGVITIGATDSGGARAHYSNFGSRLDVMAPGGDMNIDLSRDTHPDGVLSLGRDDRTGQFGYAFAQGTSMAAPHVTGLVALMKGLRPELTAPHVLEILSTSARSLTAGACNRPSGSDCGAGLVDAFAALEGTRAFVALPVEPPATGEGGPMIVAAFTEDASGELVPSGFQESSDFVSTYDFAVVAGDNQVAAWWDVNGNAEVDEGDYTGVYPAVVTVPAGARVTAVDFTLERVTRATTGSAAVPADVWQELIEALRTAD